MCSFLTSLTLFSVYKVHLCCTMYQNFLAFCGQMTLDCMNIPHFVYPFISWWTFGLLPLWIMNNTAMNIPTKVFIWTYIPSTIKSRAVSFSHILYWIEVSPLEPLLCNTTMVPLTVGFRGLIFLPNHAPYFYKKQLAQSMLFRQKLYSKNQGAYAWFLSS